MPSEHTRRRLLQVTGGALAALSGCAGVVERVRFSGGETPTDSSPAPTPGPTAAAPTADATTEADPTPTTTTADPTATESTPSLAIAPPDVSFADVPLPAAPGDHRFATMGRPEEAPTARVFGNWKCPYTRAFVVEQLDDLVDRYVRPGELAIEFRALAYRSGEPFLGPDAPRAARAGLSVWHAAPPAYWSYFGHVFGNQPPERENWATTEHLLSFADAAGVGDPDGLAAPIEGDEFAGAVRATVELAETLGVFTVPRIEVEGEVTAPTIDPRSTREQLDRAAGR